MSGNPESPGPASCASGDDDPVDGDRDAVSDGDESEGSKSSPRPGTPTAETKQEILSRLEMWGQKLGLERMRDLMQRLDAPHLATPTVLVAGTNGKGSVTTLLAAIARTAGYRVGAYYSPHLEAVEERIRVDGRVIAEHHLEQHLRRIVAVTEGAGGTLPTYFEAMTAAAFLEFRRLSVELAVLEVGLGGRLDATNVAEPVLSVITSIAFDHEEHLGSTLEAIAAEKAGIFRPGRPALVHSGGDQALADALRRLAEARGTSAEDVATSVRVGFGEHCRENPAETRQRLHAQRDSYVVSSTPATRPSSAQANNVAVAIRAAELLAERRFPRIDREAIESGARSARWPGRLELVELPTGRCVLLDGAHNPAGGAALASWLRDRADSVDFAESTASAGSPNPGCGSAVSAILLFGSLRAKRVELTLSVLAPHVRRLVLTEPEGGPRILPVAELHAAARGVAWPHFEGSEISVEADWRRALDVALEEMVLEERASEGRAREESETAEETDADPGADRSSPPDPEAARSVSVASGKRRTPSLVVAGSLYLVGAVRAELRRRFGVPEATTDMLL